MRKIFCVFAFAGIGACLELRHAAPAIVNFPSAVTRCSSISHPPPVPAKQFHKAIKWRFAPIIVVARNSKDRRLYFSNQFQCFGQVFGFFDQIARETDKFGRKWSLTLPNA